MPDSNIIKKTSLSPTVLIVGGAGFIGSHLSEMLLKKDARVVVLDNFSTGKDIYVHSLLENPKFALFNVDINQGIPKEIQSVDYIFQLAGLETYLFDKEDLSLDSMLTNALGIKNVLDFAKQCNAKMLLGSTTDVYKGLISPLNLDTYFGQTPEEEKMYSLSEAKRYAEALVWEYYKQHNVDVRIARLPEVYGPRMNLDSSGSLGFLIKSLVENNDLIVYGDGVESEYYVYINDAISGLVKALFTDGTKGKIYTFAGADAHTVLETTYLVKSLANSEVRIVFKPKPPIIQAQEPRIPDRSTLKELNWEEKTAFKEGILKTLEWLGYQANERSFKPGYLVDNQKEAKQESENNSKGTDNGKESVFSIIDAKTDTDNSSKAPHFPETGMVKGLPSHKEPHSFKFPKISLFGKKPKNKPETINLATPVPIPTNKTSEPANATKKGFFASSSLGVKLGSLFVSLLALVLIFIGVPLLQTYIHAKKGVSYLESVQTNLESLNVIQAQTDAEKAFKEFYRSQISLGKVEWIFNLAGQESYVRDIQSILSSVENTSKATYFIAKGIDPLLVSWDALKPNSNVTFDDEAFSRTKNAFESAQSNLQLAEADLMRVNISKYPSDVQDYESKLTALSASINGFVSVSSSLDTLLGIGERKSYLILFQNSNELRPTGGFIGSYAVIDIEDGKLVNILIDDIYNPDGQIDLRELGSEPPEVISEYLDEEVLHIRNANWNPDFIETSKTIEDLFYLIDGRTFDGVIAVDLHFVQNLLNITGPVFLTAYNEEINSSNLYERAQFHSEFNYEEGSDQKRSFLTVLGGKLLEKLFSLNKSSLVGASKVVTNSLNEKHLLVNIPDSQISAFLSDRHWNGSLIHAEDSDYLYVVNSNVGGTKANYYVEEGMNYQVLSKTRDGVLRAELDLDYTHTGEDNSWPGGPYTNYVRVLTQRGSKLTGAYLILDDGTKVDVFDSVTVSKEGKYNSFEFAFILDPQKSIRLSFEYDLSSDLAITKENKTYNLVWQKQPGTSDDNINFGFNAPFGTYIESTDPEMSLGSDSSDLNTVMNTDKFITVNLN